MHKIFCKIAKGKYILSVILMVNVIQKTSQNFGKKDIS